MFIKEITGYKYLIEADAQNAVNEVNAYYTLPDTPADTTKVWTAYRYSNNFNYWYIFYDVSLLPILGEPSVFEI
jgi:hypothetical protein